MIKALFICGSMNQTKMMHNISKELPELDSWFSPYYCDGFEKFWLDLGALEFTVMGGQFLKNTFQYLDDKKLKIDYEGKCGPYDLVVTCSDLIIPKNIKGSKLVLVQEGMTDPEGLLYYAVKFLRFPLWVASTSTTGLSNAYDIFCVASEGYKKLFIKKGVKGEKIVVTGIPNFDNCANNKNNSFPYRDYVLVATSDRREIYRYENRKELIEKANRIANGRRIIFKFHPNEKWSRASDEVKRYSPDAIYFTNGKAEEMVANCSVLITRFSSLAYVGIALEKEVYSDYPIEELRMLMPIQNGGMSSKNIATECRKLFA